MKTVLLSLLLAGSLLAGDRRDNDELDNDLWFIWQEQKHANDQAERDAECRRCIQQHLANDESLSWALQVCPCD